MKGCLLRACFGIIAFLVVIDGAMYFQLVRLRHENTTLYQQLRDERARRTRAEAPPSALDSLENLLQQARQAANDKNVQKAKALYEEAQRRARGLGAQAGPAIDAARHGLDALQRELNTH